MVNRKATFAAGCFWGVEEAFANIKGVISTRVGYSGGTKTDPTYEEVCRGDTGHAESVEVTFDPDSIIYRDLIRKFFEVHDPTTRDRQGPDIGSQYRSAIFYHDEEQMRVAHEVMREAAGHHTGHIVTQIVPAGPFYPAEEYHQRYLQRRGLSHCRY